MRVRITVVWFRGGGALFVTFLYQAGTGERKSKKWKESSKGKEASKGQRDIPQKNVLEGLSSLSECHNFKNLLFQRSFT